MVSTEPGSRSGSRFGPYRLVRLIGQGGLGEVYQAEDTRKDQMVALKLLADRYADGNVWNRMQREAEAAAKLDQKHVVPVYDYGEIDGSVYLATGLVDGADLASLLKSDGPLSPPRAVAIVWQVAAALDAARDAGVTHRDVKPANILVTDDDTAYLTDFGIAAAVVDADSGHDGAVPGSPDYLTPERLAGDLTTDDDANSAGDAYALTCVLFELLTGQTPFPAANAEEAARVRVTAKPPQPSRLRKGRIPVAVDEVVARGLAKRVGDRYHRAGDLATAAYQALSTAEQHQVVRILRRSGSAPADAAAPIAPAGSAAFSSASATTAVIPTASAATERIPTAATADDTTAEIPLRQPPRSWTPPDAQRGGSGAPQVDELAAAQLLDFKPSPRREAAGRALKRARKPLAIAAVLAVVAGVVSAFGYLITRPSHDEPAAAPAQTALSFNGLDYRLAPGGVAVDTYGNVYVTSQDTSGQVLRLGADATSPSSLSVTGQYQPRGIAVDGRGNVYFSDFNNRVVKFDTGSNTQTTLPFGGLDSPEGVAVDSDGNVYVADRGNNLVIKLEADSNNQVVLPFVDLSNPDGVAVDQAGNVYVTDTGNNRVLKMPSGSTQQVALPFAGIVAPWGIAVDDDGNLFVTERDSNKVVRLGNGAQIPNVLPFVDLNTPLAVAVDSHGEVYVADRGNDRVVKVDAR